MHDDLRRWLLLLESTKILPPDVVAAFHHLGSLQRDAPERAMLHIQNVMGGGVMSLAAEHIGDITHRMSHMVGRGAVFGRDKIIKTLRWLTDPYGFEREMQENIVSTARYRKIPLTTFQSVVQHALRAYATAHAALPVYNEAQWLARQAAISLGLEDFDMTRRCLGRLAQMATTEESFTEHAFEFTKDDAGNLMPYNTPSS